MNVLQPFLIVHIPAIRPNMFYAQYVSRMLWRFRPVRITKKIRVAAGVGAKVKHPICVVRALQGRHPVKTNASSQ